MRFVVLAALAASVTLTGCKSGGPDSDLPPLIPLAEQLLSEARYELERDHYSRALELVDRAAPLAPEHPTPSFLRGSVLLEMRRYSEAEAEFRRTLEIFPGYPEAWFRLGASAFRQKQFRRAVDAYRSEIALNASPRPWHNLGAAYQSLGRIDSAFIAYRKAIDVDSLYAPAYASLAELLEKEGEFEEALSMARTSVRLSPHESRHRFVYGSLLLKTDRPLDASEVLTSLTQDEPWNYGAVYSLGMAYQRLGAHDEAERTLERAGRIRDRQYRLRRLEEIVDVKPDNPEALVTLGAAYQEAGRLHEALDVLLLAEHYRPDHLGLQLNIATLLIRRGRASEAVERYERILVQDSTYAEAWLNLGSYHASVGDENEALRAFGQAVRHNPGLEPVVRRMTQRLRRE